MAGSDRVAPRMVGLFTAHLPQRCKTSTWTAGDSATHGSACFRSPTASSMAPQPGAEEMRPARMRSRSPLGALWDSLLSCTKIHPGRVPDKSTSAARVARRLAIRPAPPSFESAARCAPPHPDPEALGGWRRNTSDWRRSGYGQPLLTGSRATSAMGKKHKKHKAEWRSSYEGAEPTGGV